MRSKDGQFADWKDASAYAPLLDADRSIFAWEWLRRLPNYRDAVARSGAPPPNLSRVAIRADERAARWGLHAFEHPELAGLEARPIWRRDVYPSVLPAHAADTNEPEDSFDLERLRNFATYVRSRCTRPRSGLRAGYCCSALMMR